jgi:hypothetical protein
MRQRPVSLRMHCLRQAVFTTNHHIITLPAPNRHSHILQFSSPDSARDAKAMRLLHFDELGKLVLTDFRGKTIPPYAILSHRWSSSEILFNDVQSGAYREREEGYRKLKFCADQAAQDNLQYSWIDTCCIDKWNLSELSKAINSMFQWYKNATRCYVVLVRRLGVDCNRAGPMHRLGGFVPRKRMVHSRVDAPRAHRASVNRVLLSPRTAHRRQSVARPAYARDYRHSACCTAQLSLGPIQHI